MSSRPVTPVHDAYGTVPDHAELPRSSRPPMSHSRPTSYIGPATAGAPGLDHGQGAPMEVSAVSQSAQHEDGLDGTHRGDLAFGDAGGAPDLHRTESQLSQSQTYTPSRQGTLKKKGSLRNLGSLKRSSIRRSSRAGSVRSMQLGEKEKYGESEEMRSAFWTPVPTSAHPTDLLADRFQAWRKVLKDLITYFRDLQKSYDTRSKALHSVSNVINNTKMPSNFLSSGGLGDATIILRDFHKQALTESNKARDMENEVIMQLTGLRSDLQQKIKEIKSLSGDFKNSVDREMEGTKKAVRHLQDTLGVVDSDPAAAAGKGDPFLVKMGVERQLARQIEEENYLHRAYLNLESSGRELESIVVGEIQKALSAFAGILKRDADKSFETAERLREGPLAMAKDFEWDSFIRHNHQMVDPRIPVRSVAQITYPGKDHPAAIEVRSGMLERKSKYLKNYTPGWYILSPTHLHEFKSADRISSQAPIMSLYLPEQKLGSHSEPSSSSHKFMLKGRQTGGMHRGHAWVFRAESHDTMMAWFADIKELTEKTGEERNAFVRRTHARSFSSSSLKAGSIGGSSDGGMEEDEADRVPYSSEQSVRGSTANGANAELADEPGAAAYDYGLETGDPEAGWRPPQPRPEPGGRFPSEVNVARGLQAPQSPSSEEGSHGDRDTFAAAGARPGSSVPFTQTEQPRPSSSAYAQSEHERSGYENPGFESQGFRPSGNDEAGAAASATEYRNLPPQGRPGGQPSTRRASGNDEAGAAASAAQYQNYPSKGSFRVQPQAVRQPQSNRSGVSANAAQHQDYPPYGGFAGPAQTIDQPTSDRARVAPNTTQDQDYPQHSDSGGQPRANPPIVEGDSMAPAVAAVGGAAVGAGAMHYRNQKARHQSQLHQSGLDPVTHEMNEAYPVVAPGMSSAPITAATPISQPSATYSTSSQGNSRSLSTVPTSIDTQGPPPVSSSYFSQATMAHSQPGKVPDLGGGVRPAMHSANSANTISDLHIPGEFPKTPAP